MYERVYERLYERVYERVYEREREKEFTISVVNSKLSDYFTEANNDFSLVDFSFLIFIINFLRVLTVAGPLWRCSFNLEYKNKEIVEICMYVLYIHTKTETFSRW